MALSNAGVARHIFLRLAVDVSVIENAPLFLAQATLLRNMGLSPQLDAPTATHILALVHLLEILSIRNPARFSSWDNCATSLPIKRCFVR